MSIADDYTPPRRPRGTCEKCKRRDVELVNRYDLHDVEMSNPRRLCRGCDADEQRNLEQEIMGY